MADLRKTLLDAIGHILKNHPDIASNVERMAAAAQGKSASDIAGFAEWKRYQNLSVGEVFAKIYRDGEWGQSSDPDERYFSGTGSHDPVVVKPYIEAIRGFLSGFDRKPSVVDLGCGDFNVGRGLRDLCGSYVACDIVEQLIERNRDRFGDFDVDFRLLNFIDDDIPPAEIIFIRQVLQHLSNRQIETALGKIAASCQYLVVTEHLPAKSDFKANIDKPMGGSIRPFFGSGIVLTGAPFNLKPLDERILCEVSELGGVIRTTLYTLR